MSFLTSLWVDLGECPEVIVRHWIGLYKWFILILLTLVRQSPGFHNSVFLVTVYKIRSDSQQDRKRHCSPSILLWSLLRIYASALVCTAITETCKYNTIESEIIDVLSRMRHLCWVKYSTKSRTACTKQGDCVGGGAIYCILMRSRMDPFWRKNRCADGVIRSIVLPLSCPFQQFSFAEITTPFPHQF